MFKENYQLEYKSAVELKFPNVRLHLQDLIVKDKQLPSQAMINGAVHFGLISEQALENLKAIKGSELCLCMAATSEIILEYLKGVPTRDGFPPVKYDEIWSNISKAADSHFKSESPATEHQGEVCIRTHDCYRFAPKLFDLMLQQLLRYPGPE